MAEHGLPFPCTQSKGSVRRSIRGMESVVATVSGYHGSERFSLIKLIAHVGASYVGGMSRSITHLVCWKFHGKKYDLANKFGTIVVNHRWIEDCIKQGKRVPERPYMLQSGHEMGPLLLDVPEVPNASFSNKKLNVLSEKSNAWDEFERQNGNTELGCSSQSVWIHSSLLNEHEESGSRSSRDIVRYKRKIPIDSKSIRLETSRKGRRLVKRNMNKDQLRLALSESDEECCLIRVNNPRDDEMTVLSNHLDGTRNNNMLETGQTSNHGFYSQRETANEGLEDNYASASMDRNIRVQDSITLETTSQDQFIVEDLEEENNKGPENEPDNEFPSSNELSCVICWTDFSTVRGVLPCGHRFCYSCIQNWADHMASRRKRSTCPLCKASFTSITKFEDADANGDQKIYSQTIPCDSSMMDMFFLPDWETHYISAQPTTEPVCCACRCLEPQDLLISCHVCQIQKIHSYCLDPPLFPWTCTHCKDLHMLYLHNR